MSRGGLRPVRAHSRTSASDHRVHVLHVDGAAAPDVAVPDLAGERVDRPLAGVGRHDVEVAVDQQRRPAAVGALDAGDRRCAARRGLDDLRLDADLVELGGHPFGGRPLGMGRVGGVDADEVDEQIGDLVLGGGGLRFSTHPPCLPARRPKDAIRASRPSAPTAVRAMRTSRVRLGCMTAPATSRTTAAGPPVCRIEGPASVDAATGRPRRWRNARLAPQAGCLGRPPVVTRVCARTRARVGLRGRRRSRGHGPGGGARGLRDAVPAGGATVRAVRTAGAPSARCCRRR